MRADRAATAGLLSGAAFVLALACPRRAAADEPAVRVPEVTVAGDARAPSGSRDATAASYVVRRAELRSPGETAAEVLTGVPGVQVARTGGGAELSTASIRGATSAQTPVYVAGIRINDDVTGTADLSTVPLWMLDRIEVYRGNAPEQADRLGIGGAIFLDPVLPRGNKVGAGLGAGSFGELTGWAAAAAGDERAGAMVAVQRQGATDDFPYLENQGTTVAPRPVQALRANADFTSYDAWAIARARLGRASFVAVTNAFARDQGVPGLPIEDAHAEHAARSHVQRFLGGLTATAPCSGAGEPRCALELSSSVLVASNALVDPLGELGLSPEVTSAGQRLSEEARLRVRLSPRVRLSVSAAEQLEHLGIDREGETLAPLRARRATSRATVGLAYEPLEVLELSALGGLECHGTEAHGNGAPDRSDACGTLAPAARLGARLRLAEGLDLLGNAGRYVRVPTLGELYGTSPFVHGNDALAPEEGVTGDLGLRYGAAGLGRLHATGWVEAFGFARLASGLVAYRQSSPGVVTPYNVGSARLVGAEVSVGAAAFDLLRAEVALTALDPRDVSPGQTGNSLLPYQARLVAAPSLEVHRDALFGPRALERVALRARYFFRASRYADAPGLIVLPEQSSLDLELSAQLAAPRVAARVRVADVFDARQTDVLGLPLPGRSFHGSLEAWW